jgi:hypothetical protein
MRTGELALDGEAAAAPERAKAAVRRPAATVARDEPDLFASPAPVPEPVVQAGAQAVAQAVPEPPPAGASEQPPTHLSPDAALLQRVDPRSFRPNEKPDAYLYWLTDRDTADAAMRHGLPIDSADPVLLTDRGDVLSRLAGLAEDTEIAPASIAVLRLRRIAAAPFLEPGPVASCYRLSGRAPEQNVSA